MVLKYVKKKPLEATKIVSKIDIFDFLGGCHTESCNALVFIFKIDLKNVTHSHWEFFKTVDGSSQMAFHC